MTADIRTAAQREADAHIGGVIAQTWFVEGAVWAATRVAPTREQVAAEMKRHHFSANLPDNIHYGMWMSMCECGWESPEFHYPGESVDAYYAHASGQIAALMAGLAEGESGEQAR